METVLEDADDMEEDIYTDHAMLAQIPPPMRPSRQSKT